MNYIAFLEDCTMFWCLKLGRSIALHFLFPSYSISLLSTLLCSKGSILHLVHTYVFFHIYGIFKAHVAHGDISENSGRGNSMDRPLHETANKLPKTVRINIV